MSGAAVPNDPPTPTPMEPEDSGLEPFLLVPDPVDQKGIRRIFPDLHLGGHVARVALPVVFGMVTQAAVNILDGVMVGYLPKEVANPGQAAIGLALPFMWMVGGFLSAVWVGTQAITSRRAGEGNKELAGRALTNSLVLAVTTSVTLSGVAILVAPLIIEALYRDPVVVNLGIEYVQIRMVGVLAMVATFSYKSFFDGIGKTHLFMTAAIIMNITNVVLNFALIYGFEPLGIPRMEVAGAAVASVASAYLGLLILVLWSFAPRYLKRYHYYNPKKINAHVIREIVRLSLPNGGATIVVMIGFSAFYWVVGQVNDLFAPDGNPIIATANQVVIMASMPSFMTSLGFGTATAAVVSQSLGARRPRLAERYGWEAAKLWAWVMGLVGVLIFFFPEPLASVFNPDPEVIALAATPLRMVGVINGMVAVGMIIAQTLHGGGEAKFVMFVELVLHLFVMSPAAYFFGVVMGWKLPGVWAGPVLYATLLATAVIVKYARGNWKKIEI